MKLRAIGVLNWANLPNRNYDFRDVTLITGESGAGKTTLLDAIQTLLTGATAGLFQYNPGQEEATQQSRTKETRTLASYILGCDDGSYSRPQGAHGYIIASWVPEGAEKAEPFSAVIGVSAYLDTAGNKRTAKEEDLLLAVVRSALLGIEDFQTADKKGRRHIVPLGKVVQHFKSKRPKLSLEISRGKEDYLCRLYGAFRGQNSVSRHEARNAARALSKFMVYKPLKNLDEFVRREILEPHDLSDAIRQVSGMMRSINGMEREAGSMENGIGLLKKAQAGITGFIQTQIDEQLAQYERHSRKAAQLKKKHQATEEDKKARTRTHEELERQQKGMAARFDQLSEQLRLCEIQRHGFPVLDEKERLEKEIRRLDTEMAEASNRLLETHQQRAANNTLVAELQQSFNPKTVLISESATRRMKRLLSDIIKTDTWDATPMGKLLSEKRFDELSEGAASAAETDKAYQHLIEYLTEQADVLNQHYYQAQDTEGRFKERLKRLQAQITQLENANQVPYPQIVKRALALIHDTYPEADPQVLCDHVEVTDDSWQLAIEGLLGDHRFLILVDPGYEKRAIELIRQHGLQKSALVHGRKAAEDGKRMTLPDNSVFEKVSFTHHTAENYFKVEYGTVRLSEDIETLYAMPRGLMKNGMAVSHHKLFVTTVSEADLVFGTQARRRALKAQKNQLKELEMQYERASEQFRFMKTWHEAATKLTEPRMADRLSAVLGNASDQIEAQRRLTDLDLSECEQLDRKIQETKKKLGDISGKKDAITHDMGSHANAIQGLNERMAWLSDQHEEKCAQLQEIRHMLDRFAAQWPDFSLEEQIDAIEKNTSADPLLKYDEENYGALMNSHANEAALALEEFNRTRLRGITINYTHFKEQNIVRRQSAEHLTTCFTLSCDLARQIRSALSFLRNDILSKHKEKLSDMTRQFNNTFVSHICHTIHNAVRQGKAKLDAFNRKLRNHYFGEEYYRFEYEWIPEFQEYDKFFQEAALLNTDTGPSLFGENELSGQSRRIFQEICAKLMDEDIERSLKDLKRIADYRNYRSYDIKKCLPDRELSLKTYGAGSGGQMETPSYVIRSAGLASALRFGEGYSHLRTVLIDESFSKMDEHRCKAVLEYLSRTLELQILFAVPTKSAGALHDLVDQVVQVTKLPATERRGELNSSVMVTSNILKEKRVSKMWNKERIAIENKAHQMTFLDLVEN